MNLGVDDDDLASCVQCGLCLPHCPTWRISGDEQRSPRGRIATMRLVQRDGVDLDDAAVEVFGSCIQCRGCEPACPSGVPFGRMIATTTERIAAEDTAGRRWLRRATTSLIARHRLVLAGATLAAAAQRVPVLGRRLPVRTRLPLVRRPLRIPPAGGDEVWLLTGCVMDAVGRGIHQATVDLLVAAGFAPRLPARHEGCCGALAHHAGEAEAARWQSRRVMAAFPGNAPIVVDSAGCGAHLKELGETLGTPEAQTFAARVVDAVELLATRLDRLPLRRGVRPVVAVQDPCHLRHVQKVHGAVRQVLERVVDVVDLDDEGLCCGAGGAYQLTHAAEATALRERKLAAIGRSGATWIASANPGCSMHLAGEPGLRVSHPVEIMAAALRTERRSDDGG